MRIDVAKHNFSCDDSPEFFSVCIFVYLFSRNKRFSFVIFAITSTRGNFSIVKKHSNGLFMNSCVYVENKICSYKNL